jgi:hypothetical protein
MTETTKDQAVAGLAYIHALNLPDEDTVKEIRRQVETQTNRIVYQNAQIAYNPDTKEARVLSFGTPTTPEDWHRARSAQALWEENIAGYNSHKRFLLRSTLVGGFSMALGTLYLVQKEFDYLKFSRVEPFASKKYMNPNDLFSVSKAFKKRFVLFSSFFDYFAVSGSYSSMERAIYRVPLAMAGGVIAGSVGWRIRSFYRDLAREQQAVDAAAYVYRCGFSCFFSVFLLLFKRNDLRAARLKREAEREAAGES